MKNFALIGAAGFVAERHLVAIKETGNQLIAATDPFDVVGRMDSYFPNTEFFTDFKLFEEYIAAHPVDYTSICTPNYLHAAQIQAALHAGSNVICEKPLALFPGELEAIEKASKQSGKSVNTILQLRLHPSIIALRNRVLQNTTSGSYDIDLTYITSRGKWYDTSWKGDEHKSGGIATNIGIHFFDMLCWVFGEVKNTAVHVNETRKMAGYLEFEKARVRWFLSVDSNDLPEYEKLRGKQTFRSLTLNGDFFEFSEGFTDLHILSYEQILSGNGFSVEDAKAAIHLTHAIRHTPACKLYGELHPFIK